MTPLAAAVSGSGISFSNVSWVTLLVGVIIGIMLDRKFK